jgi:hypothetical protein
MRAYCPHTSTEGRVRNQPTPQPSDPRPCLDTNSPLRGSMRSRSPPRTSPVGSDAFRDDRALPSADVFDIQRQPVPVGSVGANTRLCRLGSRGWEEGVATEWSSTPRGPDPLGLPVRQTCTPRSKATRWSVQRRTGPRERSVRRVPKRSGLNLDRTRIVIVQMTSRGRRRVQPASPLPPADASPCSTVLPETERPPPVARVISTRRG